MFSFKSFLKDTPISPAGAKFQSECKVCEEGYICKNGTIPDVCELGYYYDQVTEKCIGCSKGIRVSNIIDVDDDIIQLSSTSMSPKNDDPQKERNVASQLVRKPIAHSIHTIHLKNSPFAWNVNMERLNTVQFRDQATALSCSVKLNSQRAADPWFRSRHSNSASRNVPR